MLLMRIVLNGSAVAITALILPGIQANWRPGGFVIAGVVFGVLNALVKPALQFLLLPAIFATYGIVVAFMNGLLLLVLDRITGGLIEIDGVLPFFTGGAVVGVIGLLLEHLLGLSPPIVDTAAKGRRVE
jgi:putative membrane protein